MHGEGPLLVGTMIETESIDVGQITRRLVNRVAHDAEYADVPWMVAISENMWHESRYHRTTYDAGKVEALIHFLIDDPHGIVLVTRHGMLFGAVAEYWYGHDLYAAEYVIYVEPEWRRGGEAVALVTGYVDRARSLGCRDIHIEASTGVDTDKTDRFFQRMGFGYMGGNFVMEAN